MEVFRQAVSVVFGEWKALQLAVEHQFGGPQSKEKAEWLENVTADYMCDNDVFSDDLAEFLATLMNQEFDTLLEDGSLTQVSKSIYDLFTKCSNGQRKEVEEFISKKQQKQQAGENQIIKKENECPNVMVGVEEAIQGLELEDKDSEAASPVSTVNQTLDTPPQVGGERSGVSMEEVEEWEVVSRKTSSK